jgi:hypothetical protein
MAVANRIARCGKDLYEAIQQDQGFAHSRYAHVFERARLRIIQLL